MESSTITITPEKCKDVLTHFLSQYKTPAFGTLPKREIDILIYQLMKDVGIISSNPSIYELVEKLHVTRSRAITLKYDANLRKFSTEELEVQLKATLSRPVIKRGDAKHICFEIENPLLTDYIRHILMKDNYAIDGSFSPTIVVLSHEMVAILLERFVPKGIQEDIINRLVLGGYRQQVTIKTVFSGMLRQFGKRFAGQIGEIVAEDLVEYSSNFLTGNIEDVLSALQHIVVDGDAL